MEFCDYLGASSIQLNIDLKTRKKILEKLTQMLSQNCYEIKTTTIFNGLLAREELGSTALGGGLAVPHCRIEGLRQPIAAILRSAKGVDYGAPDRKPVIMFFSLLVPAQAQNEHLLLLAGLASRFQNHKCVQKLLRSRNQEQIMQTFK